MIQADFLHNLQDQKLKLNTSTYKSLLNEQISIVKYDNMLQCDWWSQIYKTNYKMKTSSLAKSKSYATIRAVSQSSRTCFLWREKVDL